ncbi:O-antigen ligase family protein [Actinosynnema sp. NPDC023658]|uniref:O-antigen ligase family protein n=1 Tax=Actinosynnema sp. NPDC023658 TaxID=3155465 RepID=UPI0033D5286A
MGGIELDRVVPRDGVSLPHDLLLVLAAVTAAVVAQGGYYLPGRLLTTALVAFALVLALRRPTGSGTPLSVACAALAAWAVLRALLGGAVTDALPTVAAVGCLAATALVAQRADARQRALCASVLVGIGVLVAVTGWAAVVWRTPSWSVVADGLVRAASTLTYPNAAAALLAALAVLALALNAANPRSLPLAGAGYALVVGVGATLSRAGLLALVAGLVALAIGNGVRPSLRHAGPVGLGALIALGALTPSIPVAEQARTGLAVSGLVVGLAVTLGLSRVRPVVRLTAVVVGFAAAGVGAFLANDLGSLLGDRLSTSSPDRAGATAAALDRVAAHPWVGVGPGNGWFDFSRPTGGSRVMRYVHDEYLQVLVELGAIGLGLVLLVLAAAAVAVRRGRGGSTWAGAVAALVVLLVHSGFDFLWHLPVIVVTAGLLIALASPLPAAPAPAAAADVPTAEEPS